MDKFRIGQYREWYGRGSTWRTLILTMKLTFALTLFLSLGVQAGVFAQKVTLSKKKITLEALFKEIRIQTNYRFIFEEGLLEGTEPVSLDVKDISLDKALEKALANQGLSFQLYDGTVVVKRSAPLSVVHQQLLKGVVTDEKNQPFAGVSVRVLGKNVGAGTDEQGAFTIQADLGDSLVFSYIGYKTKRVAVQGTSLQVMMELDEGQGLDEVVVVGYGLQKKSDVTGAISSIKAEDLPKAASANVEQMLAGKAAGVQVRANDAQPGGAVQVLVRGAASTGAGNDPLYIIDGFPVSGGTDPNTNTRYSNGNRSPLNSINPNDIASIEILKDASATAIYGARAANGVILITTKSGAMGKTKVNYDVKKSFQTMQKPWEMLDASGWMQARADYLYERYLINNKLGVYGDTDPSTVAPFSQPYTAEEIAAAGAGTNWINEVTRDGQILDHNLSVSGASEKTNYLMSVNYFDQDGVVKQNDFKRITGRINLTQSINDWVKVGVKATGSKISINNPALGTGGAENTGVLESALKFTPTLPIRLADGSYSIVPNSSFFPNPVSLLEITNQSEQNRLLVQSFVEFEPIKNLKIRTQFGFDKQDGLNNIYLPKSTLYGAAVGGQANINQNNRFDQLFNATISYRKEINAKHNIDALLGYEWQSMGTSGFNLSNNNFSTDAFLTNNIGAGESQRPGVGSYKTVNELVSYFGRINYSYDNRYLLTFTMRADGSSRFGEDNRFGYFPSGAIAWRIDQEEFMVPLEWLSNAKLRLSGGQTGNSNISGAFAFYSFGSNYLFGNTVNTGTYLSSYANPDLHWETTTEYNLGLDLGFFENRVSLSTELFSKTVSGLLGQRQLKTYLPLDNVAANLGKTSSKGFEITLNTQNIKGKFQWNSEVTLSAYKDRWKERSPDVVLRSYESQTDPLRVHWGYELDGLVQPGEVIPHMPGALPGTQKVKDINGYDTNNQLTGQPDGIINDADVVKIANEDPSLIFGFGNTFFYKNFDLNIHVYGMFGIMRNNDYYGYVAELQNIDRGYNFPDMIGSFWSSSNQNVEYPNVNATNPFPGANQFLLQKADFVRVRNITLGYTLPNIPKLQKWVNSLRVYFDASNPFVFTGFKGIDPEFSGIYPPAKSYTLGLNVTF